MPSFGPRTVTPSHARPGPMEVPRLSRRQVPWALSAAALIRWARCLVHRASGEASAAPGRRTDPGGRPQPTAFLTSSVIRASASGVSSVSA